MFPKLTQAYQAYPRQFWIVVLVSFIDRIGGTLLFPFFSLYITQKFGIGMTQAGIILGIFSAFGLVGSMVGGALTDRFGRRRLILFGLVFSALSTLSLGLANTLAVLYPLAVVIGFLSNIGGPASDAMVADLLPEKQRAEGFGILRVAGNLAWIIGPTIGGLVAASSFFMLFVIDARAELHRRGDVLSTHPRDQTRRSGGKKPRNRLADRRRLPARAARLCLHGLPGGLVAHAGGLPANVQYPAGLSAR